MIVKENVIVCDRLLTRSHYNNGSRSKVKVLF